MERIIHTRRDRFTVLELTRLVLVFGIFTGDTSAGNLEYLNLMGYLCRHPESKDLVVQIELSNYSNMRGFSAEVINLSKEFFEGMAFAKVARQ